jgi:predicted nucleotidyltransferase
MIYGPIIWLSATLLQFSGHTSLNYRPHGSIVGRTMESLMRAASELSIPERTLRRAASEGLVRGERISPRRFRITLREEAYLRSHWGLLRALRAALRTEPNVRLAVLFGSTATGSDDERSDVDVLVVLDDPDVGRMAELAERLSRRLGREMQLVRLSEVQTSPVLMVDVIDHGRVLVDRDDLWSGLGEAVSRWRRLARKAERSSPAAIGEPDLAHHAA